MSGFVGSVPFRRDSRGNRLAKWAVTHESEGHVLWLRGPDEAVLQVLALAPEHRPLQVPAAASTAWTHALRSPRADIQPSVRLLLDLLTRAVSLASPPGVEFAIALDWYKAPEPGVDPYKWPNTIVGHLVSSGKYTYRYNADKQREVGLQLVDVMCQAIEGHGVLSRADVIIDVPGHDSTRVSFGSRVAATIARRRGIPMVKVHAKLAFRPEAKNFTSTERAGVLRDEFTVSQEVAGNRVLIVDDVFRSGTSMGAVATAARISGARTVYGICGVRTMRS